MPDGTSFHQFELPSGEWWMPVLLALLAGFLGGVGTGLMEELTEAVSTEQKLRNLTFIGHRTHGEAKRARLLGPLPDENAKVAYERILVKGILGSLAAICGLLVFFLSPIPSNFGSKAFWTVLTAASTLFGVVGQRVLPAIERNFGQRLGIVEEKMTGTEIKLERTSVNVVDVALLQEAMASLRYAREVNMPTALRIARDEAEQAIKIFPGNRRLNHDLAFLFFEHPGSSEEDKALAKAKGIELLTRFISYLEKIPIDRRTSEFTLDLSISYYNRACMFLNPPTPYKDPSREKYVPTSTEIDSCLSDLREAIRLRPAMYEDVKADDDLKALSPENIASLAA